MGNIKSKFKSSILIMSIIPFFGLLILWIFMINFSINKVNDLKILHKIFILSFVLFLPFILFYFITQLKSIKIIDGNIIIKRLFYNEIKINISKINGYFINSQMYGYYGLNDVIYLIYNDNKKIRLELIQYKNSNELIKLIKSSFNYVDLKFTKLFYKIFNSIIILLIILVFIEKIFKISHFIIR